MAKAMVRTFAGEDRGTITLADELFGIKPNEHVVYEVVKAYQANQRQGTHKVKGRAEVSGGGTKPWKQKGTGRARSGSNTSPLWVRGGSVFGPRPRSYKMEIPKKIRRLALRSALSDRANENHVIVVEAIDLSEPKTRLMAGFLKGLGLSDSSCLLVVGAYDEKIGRASRNIPRFAVRTSKELSAYDVVRAEWLVITREALAAMQDGENGGGATATVESDTAERTEGATTKPARTKRATAKRATAKRATAKRATKKSAKGPAAKRTKSSKKKRGASE
jgi:large subunit ribosomal protein L4